MFQAKSQMSPKKGIATGLQDPWWPGARISRWLTDLVARSGRMLAKLEADGLRLFDWEAFLLACWRLSRLKVNVILHYMTSFSEFIVSHYYTNMIINDCLIYITFRSFLWSYRYDQSINNGLDWSTSKVGPIMCFFINVFLLYTSSPGDVFMDTG